MQIANYMDGFEKDNYSRGVIIIGIFLLVSGKHILDKEIVMFIYYVFKRCN